MTKLHAFELESGVIYTFTSVSTLRRWLENKRWECNCSEEFTEWLDNFFDSGNEICVGGTHFGYLDCLELI